MAGEAAMGGKLIFSAISTFMSMKAARASGREAKLQSELQAIDIEGQIKVAGLRAEENLLFINERREVGMNELQNQIVYDLDSGTGKALRRRINIVTNRDIRASETNKQFEISSLNISKISTLRAGRFAKKQSNYRALGSFFKFGAQTADSFYSKPTETVKKPSYQDSTNSGSLGRRIFS